MGGAALSDVSEASVSSEAGKTTGVGEDVETSLGRWSRRGREEEENNPEVWCDGWGAAA